MRVKTKGAIMLHPFYGYCAAVLLMAIGSHSQAQTYDPAADFESGWIAKNNPNGVWTYGYSTSFGSSVTLYDRTAQGPLNGPQAQYWLSSVDDIGESPAVEYNNGPAYA